MVYLLVKKQAKTEGQTTQTTQATNVGHINIPDNNNSTNNNRNANNNVYHNSKNGMREAVGIGCNENGS